MRAPRIIILAFFVASSLFLLGRALTSNSRSEPGTSLPTQRVKPDKSVWGLMYYNTPFSLFPPNAAISLTDDNSTSFAARPAAFGPKLAQRGLSGQLWVGSGFAEDSIDGEGELGCSDLPGWDGINTRSHLKNSFHSITLPRVTTANRKIDPLVKRGDGDGLLDRDNRKASAKSRLDDAHPTDDGTDDYLHDSLAKPAWKHDNGPSSHADIQSLQEAAEIEGKVVMLMRGGCGFLEKVMWAQRRGAIAVIVGDNKKGGPLVQMYAHGEDVDNVTIPSVFTARTTAQLLSSLTQPGSFLEEILDDNGNPVLKVQPGAKSSKNKKQDPLSRRQPAGSSPSSEAKYTRSAAPKSAQSSKINRRNWVARMFSWTQPPRAAGDKSRPPSSGRLDWVAVEDWNEERDQESKESKENTAQSNKATKPGGADDDFVIGVQDWRDPDVVDKAHSGGSKDSADSPTESSGGLMSALFGTRDPQNAGGHGAAEDVDEPDTGKPSNPDEPEGKPHEGLWVTITPTGSASPFFDTLLVLVVSPLITLTVVYALLLLRARIRRRRWRAPKSVVERLPVRTYHTVAASPSPSSRLPSPSSTSPTTPLLQQEPSRPRPRSRTTTGVLESENLVPATPPIPTPRSRSRARGRSEREKGSGGFSAEWKKYMGRQVECVVCLEEYVDGVSRVMSLPCGHEFHEDCM